MWNGTADILNAKPTSSRPTASSAIVDGGPAPLRREDDAELVEPGRARDGEREGDAVEEERARERAEQEILERRFGAAGARARMPVST